MSKKLINILLLLTLIIIVVVVVADYLSTRPGSGPPNPYAFDVSEYETVSENLISYREIRQIRLTSSSPVDLAYLRNNIYLLNNDNLQVITLRGEEVSMFPLEGIPGCVLAHHDHGIIIAFEDHLASFSHEGTPLSRSLPIPGGAILTAIATAGDKIFVADAGTKQVHVFNRDLEPIGSFRGESGVSALHGFILPSAHFDLAVNPDNELWVVNPGLHSLQLYADDGRFRRQWGTPAFTPEGFSGCCNPSHITFLSDGRMVTSEKGLVRIKIYQESGVLESVAVPPEAFKNAKRAPAIAATENDLIIALDYDQNMLRIFEPEKKSAT